MVFFILGLETLHLRIERHSKSALEIAKFLKNHPKVKKVNYPFLEGDENYKYAKKYLKYAGGILSFELESYEEAKEFIKNLKNIDKADLPIHLDLIY